MVDVRVDLKMFVVIVIIKNNLYKEVKNILVDEVNIDDNSCSSFSLLGEKTLV